VRHPPSLSVTLSLTVVALLAGCSGGGGGGSSEAAPERSERSAERTPTTAAPARIDLSKPIPGGSLHGTPRPPLENSGDDYVAIFESLDANLRWISENPDPALISEVYVPGTPNHDTRIPAYQFLVDNSYRWADEGYQLISVKVADARPEAVSLLVTDSLQFERLVDAAGNQVGEIRPREPVTMTWLILLVSDNSSRWRIADWVPANGGTVEL